MTEPLFVKPPNVPGQEEPREKAFGDLSATPGKALVLFDNCALPQYDLNRDPGFAPDISHGDLTMSLVPLPTRESARCTPIAYRDERGEIRVDNDELLGRLQQAAEELPAGSVIYLSVDQPFSFSQIDRLRMKFGKYFPRASGDWEAFRREPITTRNIAEKAPELAELFRGSPSEHLRFFGEFAAAVDRAYERGIAVVASSGNQAPEGIWPREEQMNMLGLSPKTVVVGATVDEQRVADYSGTHRGIDGFRRGNLHSQVSEVGTPGGDIFLVDLDRDGFMDLVLPSAGLSADEQRRVLDYEYRGTSGAALSAAVELRQFMENEIRFGGDPRRIIDRFQEELRAESRRFR